MKMDRRDNELAEIAAVLQRLTRRLETVRVEPPLRQSVAKDHVVGSGSTAVNAARRILAARRARSSVLTDDFFGEPAWDILLDLFVAYELQGEVSVSSACIGSAVAPTTALRWLQKLEQAGVIERSRDPLDHRRCFVALAPKVAEQVRAWLQRWADAS